MSFALAIQEQMGSASLPHTAGAHVVCLHDSGGTPTPARCEAAVPEIVRSQRMGQTNGPARDVIVNLVRCHVIAHIARRPDLTEIAAVAGVSESTLRRAIVSETGQQLAHFITNIRLNQAHAWLSTNRESRSVAQIAAALGYDSSAAISRSYRRRFGQSMSETRRRAVMDSENRSE